MLNSVSAGPRGAVTVEMVRVLRVPGFLPLLAGQAVNAIGNWVALIAIWGFAAFRFDAGAGDLALLFVVLAVPGAFLGPLLGVPIDRLGPDGRSCSPTSSGSSTPWP